MEIIIDIIIIESYLIVNGAILHLFVSMCWHHQAFLKILRHAVRQLDDTDKNRNDKEFLRKLIRFHVSVKE